MLILAKAALAIMLGFIVSMITGLVLIPLLRKLNIRQRVSLCVGERHIAKDGTLTMGGLIFILSTILVVLFLYFRGSIEFSSNLLIVIFVFVAFAILGFVDDYLKIKFQNNKGLSIFTKFIIQALIALVFFYIFMSNGGNPVLEITLLNLTIPMGWVFGLFIFFVLVGTTNAVNITDGLDGLAGGLSMIAFFAFGIISWGTSWINGYQDIAIFCFVLVGSLLGFLFFNTKPAKIFMGDIGALSLGGALATVAIITRHELLLIVVGGVFVIETLSSIIQIIAIRKFNKKVFLMAPIHHHFEKLNWDESSIVKLFWAIGFLLAMLAITYGVWI